MTLDELDRALEKTGLDLSVPGNMELRDRILTLHGKDVIQSKKERCQNCWLNERGKCMDSCFMKHLSSDPLEASKQYLGRENNVNLFPFLFLYMIPVYKEVTGDTKIVQKLKARYESSLKKKAAIGQNSLINGF